MDTKAISDEKFLSYDPHIFGYSANFFYKVSGTVELATGGKIRVNGGSVYSKVLSYHGNTVMKMIIPTAPTAGDNRMWGFYSWVNGNKNAAHFFITGENFYARSYDEVGDVAEQTTLTWNSAWTDAATDFEIRRRVDRVEFYIAGVKVATHAGAIDSATAGKIPRQVLMPMYWSNSNADSMYISNIEIVGARKLDFSLTKLFNSTNVGSTSPSPSPSISQSVSQSTSQSISQSKSESVSQSVSESVSQSISQSVSESVSQSVSESVSQSASVSGSVSESASQSVSYSDSVSESVSQSASVSGSVSESVSQSISQSVSESVSQSVSESVSQSASVSGSVSESVSQSVSASVSGSVSNSISQSVSQSASYSASVSQSISQSASYSASVSQSISQSASISESVSPSASPSIPQ